MIVRADSMPVREDLRRGSGLGKTLRLDELSSRDRLIIMEEQMVQDLPRRVSDPPRQTRKEGTR